LILNNLSQKFAQKNFSTVATSIVSSASLFVFSSLYAQGSSEPVLTPGSAAAGSAAPSSSAPPPWINFVLFGGIFVFMYFFMIRPQMKRQKEHKTFVESLKVGLEVVTSSGIIGKIVSITDTVITLDIGNSTIRVLKSSVSAELPNSSSSQLTASAVAK
jgi:preprotein translocase subunit YajC